MKINLADTEAGSGFDPLPEDRYDLEIVSLEERTSNSGNPMLSMRFKVINHDSLNNRNLFTNFVLTEKSLWNLRAFLDAIGCEELVEREFDTAELQELLPGRTVSSYVTIRTWEGKKSNNLAQWTAIDDSGGGMFA